MKKIVFVFVLLLATLTACEGPVGPMGPSGRNGKDGVINKIEYIFTIKPGEWDPVGRSGENGAYYRVEKYIDELTDDVYFDKQFLLYGYLVRNFDLANEYQTLLPFDTYGQDSGTGAFYSETYDFDVAPGTVIFNLTPSDFILERPQENKVYRVVLFW